MISVLLLIDVTEDYLKPWGSCYIGEKESERVVNHIREQLHMARKTKTPVIYAITNNAQLNKNNGIITELAPGDDILIKKSSLSAFTGTSLEFLLRQMKAQKLIVAGVCTDTSILFTLYDAKIRNYELAVFEDCIAACERIYHTFALKVIRDTLGIEVI